MKKVLFVLIFCSLNYSTLIYAQKNNFCTACYQQKRLLEAHCMGQFISKWYPSWCSKIRAQASVISKSYKKCDLALEKKVKGRIYELEARNYNQYSATTCPDN